MQGKAHKTSKQKHLQGTVYDRSIKIAEYIIENNDTVRGAAKIFGISKSTVHKDLITRLPEVDLALYKRVRKVLDKNKQERHLRGGLATKMKYINKCKSN